MTAKPLSITAIAVALGTAIGVLTLAVGLAMSPLSSGVAQAHATLVETSPKDGSTIDDEPGTVTFTFNQNIGTPAYVVAEAPDGSRIETGDPKILNDEVSQKLTSTNMAGDYKASYRVISADGHPISGTITFTVRNGKTVTSATENSQTTQAEESFLDKHGTHLLMGAGGIVVAAALLLWPRKKKYD